MMVLLLLPADVAVAAVVVGSAKYATVAVAPAAAVIVSRAGIVFVTAAVDFV
jgi:hypothetical protein